MRVGVPDALTGCFPSTGEADDHGFTALLDHRPAGDCQSPARRRMEVSAYGNVIYVMSTLAKARAQNCAYYRAARCVPGPPRLGVHGWPTLSSLMLGAKGGDRSRTLPKGAIVVTVYAETGASPRDIGPEGTLYEFALQTDRAHYRQDLAIFRRMLKTVRLWVTTTPDE
jgi:hypothetical protein